LQSTDTYGSQHLDSANREKHLTFKDDRTALGRVASLALAGSIIAFAAAACTHLQGSNTVVADWGVYGGPTGDRYSPLKQINRANVSSLREVWRVETGLGGVQTSPLMIDGMLYIVTAKQDVMALDAATGRTLWTWDAPEPGEQPVRGLTYWADGGQRLLFTSNGPFLAALNPSTGLPVLTFGKNGRIDLREGLGRDPEDVAAFLTSPGVIYGDVIITGFRTSENHPAAPGAIRAYDVRTGAVRWTFNLIPRPGEPGHESWPTDAWKTAGGANNWPGMVVDHKRGIVFVPTGSPVDDFYGGDRPGDNLYSDSLVALDARSGRRLWHFQAVHHDIWDRDFPSPPVLVTVARKGKRIDAVVQPSKQGFLFMFDRVTGKPLFPVEERRTPQSSVPGEQTSPTQPFVLKPAPYARQVLTEDMLTRRTPQAHAAALAEFRKMRNGGPFMPFAVGQDTIVFPGFDGGAEWGGPAVDRLTNIIYLNSNDVAWRAALAAVDEAASPGERIYNEQCSSCHGADREGSPPEYPTLVGVGSRLSTAEFIRVVHNGKGRMPGFPHIRRAELNALTGWLMNSSSGRSEVTSSSSRNRNRFRFTGYRKWLDDDGYPAVAPPWGTLNAIDLDTGEYVWRIPFGEYPELAAQGMFTGSENYGGPVVTAGGVLIIGATIYDRKLRAFDAGNGTLLWQHVLPYSGTATPITYRVGGKQFVVIAASGSRDPKGPQGSAYVAFALP
jgi:quinoprotein glucose dehydrogenase